jgi:hypothetical protein
MQRRFDRLVQLFPDALPYPFRTQLVRARRRLDVERYAYLAQSSLTSDAAGAEVFFRVRFESVVRVLRAVARDADSRREALTAAAK